MALNILQYESKIWNTADLLRGSGIKESEWPSFMMPFFALVMVESRLVRMLENLRADLGADVVANMDPEDRLALIHDEGQGYNQYIFEHNRSLKDICLNDKSFEIDFEAYLQGFDAETKELLGVDPGEEHEKFLDIRGVIAKLKNKKVLFSYTKEWSEIDLKPFNNSEITTLEEHIKRKWADISAETAGEQYTPDDVIALIAEIIATKIEDTGTLLKIYDCTCGGGNLLFGVEDRIAQKVKRFTQTFGQDWNDSLYALAKIESRFRKDSRIEHGNTLTEDKFYNEEMHVVIANPPYGVSWKGYQKEIINDKTQRFKYIPSVSDGQLLFMQHLISKLDATGMGVIVHNGSTLFSGDAGSAESNIRKWMLDSDIVEAIIQLPTGEFFNTGIYTYLWVLNKNKDERRRGKVMLINASEKFKPLKKNKGEKRKEIDDVSRQDIVAALAAYQDNNFARIFEKEFFYFNKQTIQLTNVDENGKSFAQHLEKGKKSLKLHPVKISNGDRKLTEFTISSFDSNSYESLQDKYEREISPFLASLDPNEPGLVVYTKGACYFYDSTRETLVKEVGGKQETLGCGKIVIKATFKLASKSRPECIEVTVDLVPSYEKDFEIIPYLPDEEMNRQAIDTFMTKYVTRPFEYIENVIGVEINFNKVFYKPESLRSVSEIQAEIDRIDGELKSLEEKLKL